MKGGVVTFYGVARLGNTCCVLLAVYHRNASMNSWLYLTPPCWEGGGCLSKSGVRLIQGQGQTEQSILIALEWDTTTLYSNKAIKKVHVLEL